MSTSGTGNAVAVAAMTNWTLDFSTDKTDVTAFQDENKQYVQGMKDVSGTLSGIWDDTSDSLYDAMSSVDGVKMYVYPSTLVPTKYFYGPAFVDMSLDVDVNAAVKVAGKFSAAGNWGQQ
jgi:hypothetical protein